MSTTKTSAQVPKLRFPGFEGEWWKEPLQALSEKAITYGIVQTGEPVEDGVRCVRVVDLTKPQIDLSELITTTPEISRSYKRTILEEGEIMVALRGEIGLVAMVPGELAGSNLTRGIARIAPKRSEVTPGFLLWSLRTDDAKTEFNKQVNGSALKEIPINGLNKVEAQLTTVPEQQKIAAFLTAVDGRIEQLSRKKALLEATKKGVMQQLFTQTLRFQDDHGHDFPDWEEKRFESIYSFKNTNSLSRDQLTYEAGQVRNIHYGDIHTKFRSLFRLTEESVPFIKSDVSVSKIADDCYCRPGDLVIADVSEDYADVGKCIEIMDLNGEKTVAGLHTFIARPKKGQMAPGFGAYLMQSRAVRHRIMIIAQGTKVLGISKPQLSKLKILVPHRDEQTKIAGFLSALDGKIGAVGEQMRQTQAWKKGLLQQMFV